MTRLGLWVGALGWATLLALPCQLEAQSVPAVSVVVDRKSPIERQAALELIDGLQRKYASIVFREAESLPAQGPAILVGALGGRPELAEALGDVKLTVPESYAITTFRRGERSLAAVVGRDPLGAYYGVCALLEQLGFAFGLSYDGVPVASGEAFSYEQWKGSDAPLVKRRIVFNWHNFLSGCSGWNAADWRRWASQARKMRFNTIMVHAYGNNPMFTFDHLGATKEVGFLPSSVLGRDWGNAHVNDVRRLPGGHIFPGALFGADAALAPEANRVAAVQALMREAFDFAAVRGLHICFALDVDTTSSQPQAILRLLPAQARFDAFLPEQKGVKICLANPDAPEGYAYYKAQVTALLQLYPQIDRLAFWIRVTGTPWLELRLEDLPLAWREAYRTELERDPKLAEMPRGPGRFALGRLLTALQRIVKEAAGDRVELLVGSWGFEWLEPSDRFFPREMAFVPLDYGVLHEKSDIENPASRALLRRLAARREVVPIAWAHHDDGHYIGRPYTPPQEFQDKLTEAGASGFGIIHWTTHPLDLYFKSLARQVWESTRNEPLAKTCRFMASGVFGPHNADLMGQYWSDWLTTGPQFGRETCDWFIDRPFTQETVDKTLADCARRLKILQRLKATVQGTLTRPRLDYFHGLEQFCADFYRAEGAYQRSLEQTAHGDLAAARKALDACQPERLIDQYARLVKLVGPTRGEQGVVLAMALNWLPYVEAQRQALGLAPLRYRFGVTQHEPQAQGAGRLTFYVDPERRLWRTLGPRETGAAAFTLPAGPRPDADPLLAELAQQGIETDQRLTLALRPITADVRPGGRLGKISPVKLVPGRYRVRLYLAATENKPSTPSLFDVAVRSDGVRQPAIQRVDLLARLRDKQPAAPLEFPVEVGAAGKIEVLLTPVEGKAALSAAVVEPWTE